MAYVSTSLVGRADAVLAGQRKGEVVRVDSYDRAQCVVINPDNSFAMDIPTDQLAKLHES